MKIERLQILLLPLLFLQLLAAPKTQATPIILKLCDVKLAKDLLPTTKEEDLFQKKFDNIESYSKHDELVNKIKGNEFINTLHYAFTDHRPIEITPDQIWMLIAQGFSYHIANNSEELRNKFVYHTKKQEIEVRNDDLIKGLSESPWEKTFPVFKKEIEHRVGEKYTNLISAGFSTTTPTEDIAFQITLMDSMKTYFNYSTRSLCGIPSITLKGTVKDWEDIINRAEQLREYDLDWWIDELIPILNEFVITAKGSKSVYFWNSMYKYERMSGGDHINGWIIKFFPYAYGYKNREIAIRKNRYINSRHGMKLSNFPPGMSQTPFIWKYLDKEFKMEFLAGFIGVKQDKKTKALTPEIGWVVRYAVETK